MVLTDPAAPSTGATAGGVDLEAIRLRWAATAPYVAALCDEVAQLRSDLAHAQAELVQARIDNKNLQGDLMDSDHNDLLRLRAQLAQRDSLLATLQAVVEALRGAISAEHFRMNGASVYMEGPQHEHARSKMRCTHPLCLAVLDQAQQQQQQVPD